MSQFLALPAQDELTTGQVRNIHTNARADDILVPMDKGPFGTGSKPHPYR